MAVLAKNGLLIFPDLLDCPCGACMRMMFRSSRAKRLKPLYRHVTGLLVACKKLAETTCHLA